MPESKEPPEITKLPTEISERQDSPVERRQKIWRAWIDEEFQKRNDGKISEKDLKDILAEKLRVTDDELTKQIQLSQARTELLTTDELTEIPSGYLFDQEIEDLVASKEKFGLIIMDIDNFRNLNTKYGHFGADKLMRQLAHTLEAALRSNDNKELKDRQQEKVYRLHGDEKAVLVSGIEKPEDLLEVAERLRIAVEQASLRSETGEVVPLTMSFGGAMYDGSNIETFIDRVDKKALYGAKENGKNNSFVLGISDQPKAA